MNVFCNGCGMCCKIIPVKIGDSVVVRDGFQIIDEEFMSCLSELSEKQALDTDKNYVKAVREIFYDVKFYRCSYLNQDNKCTADTKPSFCNSFPSTPLAMVPEECACLGDVFMKNEQLKRKIRMIKEEILDYETLIENGDKDAASYKKIVENLTRFVTKYKDFGSDNW